MSVTQTADASFAGALQDASLGRVLALTKGGSGTLTLNGGITVNPGGTLDKTGYAISNAITNNGGTVLG